MGAHSTKRRGAALALAGAVVVGTITAAAVSGTAVGDPLTVPAAPGVGTTTVLPDLAPFTTAAPADTRGAGTATVDTTYGAPTGGGKASLHTVTPAGTDKVQALTTDGLPLPLGRFVGNAAYSAFQGKADNPIQFPSYQLVIDFNGPADGGFSTLTYEPVYNDAASKTAGQWNRYDVGTTGVLCSTRAIPGIITEEQRSCSNGGTHTLAEYVAAAPDAIVNAVQINQGSGNPGLDAAVDLVQTPKTTYDFELEKATVPVPPIDTPTVPTKPQEPTEPTGPTKPEHPKPGDWGNGPKPGHGGSECGCPKR